MNSTILIKQIKPIRALIGLCLLLLLVLPSIVGAQSLGAERVKRIKEATVQVLLDGKSAGTAFFLTDQGYIVTCFHVIESAFVANGLSIRQVKKIAIKLHSGEVVGVEVNPYMKLNKYADMQMYDYASLNFIGIPKTPISYLEAGAYSDIEEGEEIVTAGYPLGISQNVIARGLLSTKWRNTVFFLDKDSTKIEITRDAAWLDLTMNRGNSGGPIIRLGKTSEDDRVVGIATFILNPMGNEAQLIADFFEKKKGKMKFSGVDVYAVNSFLAKSVTQNSLGVSGLISINYLLEAIKR